MYPFARILFPVDFSKRCESIVPAVRAMAAKHGSAITLFHALDMPPGGYAEWYSFAAMVDLGAIRDHTRRSLDRFAERCFPGEMIETVLSDGRPVDALVDYMHDNTVDLLMLPSHGRGKFRSMLLGSVTSGLLHDVSIPVWTATHTIEEPIKNLEYRNVLCAVDLEKHSVPALELAKHIADDYGATLQVIHSEPSVEDLVHSDSAIRFREFLAYRARESYAPIAKAAGVETPVEVIEGAIGESIAAAAMRYDADLLVIGRGVVKGTFGRMRTHVTDIIKHSPCPVLTV